MPNGIPINVIHSTTPKIRWENAIQIPPINIQMMFNITETVCDVPSLSIIFLPNGVKLKTPTLKHCKPNGIPMIVKHNNNPPKRYSKKINSPPNNIQNILPIVLINSTKFVRWGWCTIIDY